MLSHFENGKIHPHNLWDSLDEASWQLAHRRHNRALPPLLWSFRMTVELVVVPWDPT